MNNVSELDPKIQMWSQVSLVPFTPETETGRFFETRSSRPALAISSRKNEKDREKEEVKKGGGTEGMKMDLCFMDAYFLGQL